MNDNETIIHSWRNCDIDAIAALASDWNDQGRPEDSMILQGLRASISGDYALALKAYSSGTSDAFLSDVKVIESKYCSTKLKLNLLNPSIKEEIKFLLKLFNRHSGEQRQTLIHHHLYVWYISAFWHSQTQSMIAGILLMLTALCQRYKEGLIHGTFLVGHVLNIWGTDWLGVSMVEWAFNRRACIHPWKHAAFLSYMAYGLYMTGRKPDLASTVLGEAKFVLSKYPDHFYEILFLVSQIRQSSQSGDIETTESIARHLVELAQSTKIMRFYYSAMTDLALCYSIRGLYSKADDILKSIETYSPNSSDPVEGGTFYRIRGWSLYYLGRYEASRDDALKAATCFSAVGSFRLARQMVKILEIASRFRIKLQKSEEKSTAAMAIMVGVYWFKISTLKLIWQSNSHVKKVLNDELGHLKQSALRFSTTSQDRSAAVSKIQMDLLEHIDEIVRAPHDQDAWSFIFNVLEHGLKVSCHSISESLNSEIFRVRGTTGNQDFLEFSIPRIVDGKKLTNIVVVRQNSAYPLASIKDALYTLQPAISALFQNRDLNADMIKNASAVAIANTTQMLAHDVRKPFSILRIGLGMINQAKDMQNVKKIMGLMTPEIEKALASVNGMLSDVMEIGAASSALQLECQNPQELIESIINDMKYIYPQSQVKFHFNFKHQHMIQAHHQKISRVLANIVGNAQEAMNFTGAIWFKTHEFNGFTQFCVGNSGSYISKDQLGKLFDAYYTHGKKSGTGLGLSIASKIIAAHGGKIWCESEINETYPEGQVEFYFTVPTSKARLSHSKSQIPLGLSGIPTLIDPNKLTLSKDPLYH